MQELPQEEARWYYNIPKEIQQEIGEAVLSQLGKLPPQLQVEWYKPCDVEKSFFNAAASYIDIPHSEYWKE